MNAETSHMYEEISKELEAKKTARGIYNWIRWLPLISFPWMVWLLFSMNATGIGELFMVAIIPGIPYFLVLLMFQNSSHRFVVGHARQAFLLVVLRALSAYVSLVVLYEGSFFGLLLFFFGNGALWHFGTRWGIRQVDSGECWWLGWRRMTGQQVLSSRSIQELEEDIRESKKPAEQGFSVQDAAPAAPSPKTVAVPAQKASRDQVEAYLLAYRRADPVEKQQLLREMEALGLVEEF